MQITEYTLRFICVFFSMKKQSNTYPSSYHYMYYTLTHNTRYFKGLPAALSFCICCVTKLFMMSRHCSANPAGSQPSLSWHLQPAGSRGKRSTIASISGTLMSQSCQTNTQSVTQIQYIQIQYSYNRPTYSVILQRIGLFLPKRIPWAWVCTLMW